MIDLSDGLAADLGHILKASDCGAIIDSESLKNCLPDVTGMPGNQVLDAALHGGDDYELLFTVSANKLLQLEQSWQQSFSPLTQIGEITKDDGMILKQGNGKHVKIAASGYNHFHD
jgi:thiamine-monophosphate kinase